MKEHNVPYYVSDIWTPFTYILLGGNRAKEVEKAHNRMNTITYARLLLTSKRTACNRYILSLRVRPHVGNVGM